VPGTVVIGAGQAGLAVSHELEQRGVEHVVLERGRVGQRWRTRWESFCLVTPNWTVQLPGAPYDGDDPDGYMPRDAIVEHLERWAERLRAPVHEGVEVRSLARAPGGRLPPRHLRRRADRRRRRGLQRRLPAPAPHAARGCAPAPHRVLDADGYTAPGHLPPGPVLVIGSGQTGCQLAEELRESGREVFLACGRAPWHTRRIGDQDIMWWAVETGYLDDTLGDLPGPIARLGANFTATGRHGRDHDLHLRTLDALGVRLLGHLEACDGRRARFADDLAESVAWGDARRAEFLGRVRQLVADRGLAPPPLEPPRALRVEPLRELDLGGFGAVIVTAGFRPDYARWIEIQGAFDGFGFPRHRGGQSTAAPGLFFAGVHFLRTRKSALLFGVGEDTAVVADGVAAAA
jgi:putative flavoprotein involved in K+ transport